MFSAKLIIAILAFLAVASAKELRQRKLEETCDMSSIESLCGDDFQSCGKNGDKVLVCHRNKKGRGKTLCIDVVGACDHLSSEAHTDTCGRC